MKSQEGKAQLCVQREDNVQLGISILREVGNQEMNRVSHGYPSPLDAARKAAAAMFELAEAQAKKELKEMGDE